MLTALTLALAFQVAEPPAALPPVPSERQLAWHEREFYGFVHFGPNTFSGREWGTGREEPSVFDPTALDCRQWVRTAKDAGMSGIILTAKHHDGFCLWQTETSQHSVVSSPWKSGQGDVLRELAEACREEGLGLGVYLSPWDRHEESYGDSPRYNDHFVRQLTEVLTGYGDVFEVWFDGACGEGPNGKRQEYDWPRFIATVREHQPAACIFSDAGPDVRWIGNERGYGAETSWSLLRRDEFTPGTPRYKELTEGHADGTHWLPPEADVSIRSGWFWSGKGALKSLEELTDIWYASVGRNANLLLNLTPDRRGLIPEEDGERLRELRALLDATFDRDLARAASVQASNVRAEALNFGGANANDGDPQTYWAADDGVTSAKLVLEFEREVLFDRVVLAEHIALGQRVLAFRVEVPDGDNWRAVGEGTTIGRKRILRLSPTKATKVRLWIRAARACPTISSFELYLAPPDVRIQPAGGSFLGSRDVALSCAVPGAEIRFTLDGSEPTSESPRYERPLRIAASGKVRARAYAAGKETVFPQEATFRRWSASELRPPITFIRQPPGGLRYAYYEGGWQSLKDLPNAKAKTRGSCADFDLSVRERDEHFALRFDGFVEVPRDGIYTFSTKSDDGSRLFFGADRIVENDGLHGMLEASGEVGLRGWLPPHLGRDVQRDRKWRARGLVVRTGPREGTHSRFRALSLTQRCCLLSSSGVAAISASSSRCVAAATSTMRRSPS